MPLGLKQALITYCNHPALLSWKCIDLVTFWVVFLCHRNQLNVLVEFRVHGCLFVGVRSIARDRITQRHNHPLLSFRTHLEVETFYVV